MARIRDNLKRLWANEYFHILMILLAAFGFFCLLGWLTVHFQWYQ